MQEDKIERCWRLECKCGWKGDNTQLKKTGCLTDADEWWVCPECGGDASEMEKESIKEFKLPNSPDGLELIEKMRDAQKLRCLGKLAGIPILVDEHMPAGTWRLIVAPDVMKEIEEDAMHELEDDMSTEMLARVTDSNE